MFISLYHIFYTFDIESMSKLILHVSFSMSAKLDECRVPKGVLKFASLLGCNSALVRQAFIELLLEKLTYWKVSTSDLGSLDTPLWGERL